MNRTLALLAAALLTLPALATHAGSQAFPPGGYIVADTVGNQTAMLLLRGPHPGVRATVFHDQRGLSGQDVDLYLSLGHGPGPGSAPNGIRVAVAPGFQMDPAGSFTGFWYGVPVPPNPFPSPPGGIVIAWRDEQPNRPAVLRVGRPVQGGWIQDPFGPVTPWPDTGLIVAPTPPVSGSLSVVGDDSAGAIVVWRGGPNGISAQRIRTDGSFAWGATGIALGGPSLGIIGVRAVTDGNNGAYVLWLQADGEPIDPIVSIRALRVGPDGEVAAGWDVQGKVLKSYPYFASSLTVGPLMLADPPTLVTVWGTVFPNEIVVQRWLPDGTPAPGFSAAGNGYLPGGPTRSGFRAEMGDIGLLLAWSEEDSPGAGVFDVRCAVVGRDGSVPPEWSTIAGIPVRVAPGSQTITDVVENPDGMCVGWDEDPAGGGQPRVQRILHGTVHPDWPDSGAVLTTLGSMALAAFLSEGYTGGVDAVWNDFRNFTQQNQDVAIYGQTLNAIGNTNDVGPPARNGGLAIADAWPNPSSGRVRFRIHSTGAAPLRAEILDVAGRRVRSLPVPSRSAGPLELAWDGRDERGGLAPPGVHFLRVCEADQESVRRFVRLR